MDLHGMVCVVTGASRGAGRGIAIELGAGGATVYVTGRRPGSTGNDRQGSLEETVGLVGESGGTAVAVRCDHTVDEDVAGLFQQVREEQGRLDLLVNNAWGGYEQRGDDPAPFFDAPFWEQPLWRWDGMFTAGVRASFVSSRYAAPLLLERRAKRPGLIVNTIAWAFGAYLGNVLYDTAKAATARMAFGMAQELQARRVAAVALALGHLNVSESPRDVDGSQPEPFALPGVPTGP
jgi:NAD(P)-dependent dehydrogenase (short-subunit alcohol dehydrogenase family)